jgi:hypothetical protein
VVASMLRVSRHFSVPVAGMDTDWQVICAKSYGCAFQMVRSRPRKFLTPAPRDALQDIGPWNLRGRR